jgi:hypothetical protein
MSSFGYPVVVPPEYCPITDGSCLCPGPHRVRVTDRQGDFDFRTS